MSPTAGARVGQYEVLGQVGAGGMGHVYRARDTRLGRDVALKVLPAASVAEPKALERFRREALAASALNHPNIITIYGLIESEFGPVLAMELIDGTTLREVLLKGPQTQLATEWLLQVAQALTVAHASGVVHRDLKPDNIMVRRDGYLKILDFGIARLTNPVAMPGEDGLTSTGTVPGVLLGTVRYMSPEQVRGDSAGTPSDIFSIGLVWYELITGKHPFAAESAVSTMHKINSVDPLRPSHVNPDVPLYVNDLVLRMLEKNPQLRPAAKDIVTELLSAGRVTAFPVARTTRAESRDDSTIGRQVEMAALREASTRIARDGGRLLCIAGEAGIGKTTLAEMFLRELEASGNPPLVGRGRCSERLAGTEAYLPFLESLDNLLHDYPDVARPILKQHAPGWQSQVVTTTHQGESLPGADGRSVSQEKLKRELHLFLRELSAVRPVVLFFDDLHWADASTIDLLSHVASQIATMRLLVLITYRASDMMVVKHPFLPVRLSLQARGLLTEVCPALLSREEVAVYVARAFPNHTFSAGFIDMLHARTDGHPLFVTDLLAYLRDRGTIARDGNEWRLTTELADVVEDLPASVRSMVERKIDQLPEEDRKLLVAASVQGYEFDSAIVADVQGVDAAEVEERLDVLDRVHSFVRLVNEDELPDRTLSVRYRFFHVLYQNALYASLRPTRRVSLASSVATSLEKHLEGKRESKAAELAILYETARRFDVAAGYFLTAARNAGAKFAAGEAAALAKRGIDCAKSVAPSDSRLTLNLELEVSLAFSLRITRGNAARETGSSMLRARELAEQAGRTEYVPALLWGLWLYYQVGGDLATAQHFGEQLLALGMQTGDREVLLGAHTALGITAVHQGQVAPGHEHLRKAITFHDTDQHATYVARYNLDPGVYAGPGLQRTFWLLGFPDQAGQMTVHTLSWCDRFQDPQSVAFIHVFAAFYFQFVRDVAQARKMAEICIAICDEHGIVQEREWVAPVYGWALAKDGSVQEGLAVLRASLDRHRSIQSQLNVPYYMTLLAETLLEAGRIDDGLQVTEDALQVVGQTEQRSFLAEIYRLKGELLFQKEGGSESASEAVWRAVEIAEGQSARSLQLRAAVSLCRMLEGTAAFDEAKLILRRIYDAFTEGFDRSDLVQARQALGS